MSANLQLDPTSGFATGMVSQNNVAWNNFAQVRTGVLPSDLPPSSTANMVYSADDGSADFNYTDFLAAGDNHVGGRLNTHAPLLLGHSWVS